MSEVRVSQPHNVSLEDARRRVQSFERAIGVDPVRLEASIKKRLGAAFDDNPVV